MIFYLYKILSLTYSADFWDTDSYYNKVQCYKQSISLIKLNVSLSLNILLYLRRFASNLKNVLTIFLDLCLKWTYGHSGIDCRVAMLSKLYLTTTGIIMQSLESIGQFNLFKLTKIANCDGRTDGPTLIIEKLRF